MNVSLVVRISNISSKVYIQPKAAGSGFDLRPYAVRHSSKLGG